MVLGDVIKITSNKVYADQILSNVYWYVLVSMGAVPNTISDIAQLFYSLEAQALLSWTSQYLYSGTIIAENVSNGNERGEYTPTQESLGSVTGDPSPAHDAVAVRLNRTTQDTRHGQKRYGGIAESAYSSGILSDTTTIVNALTPILTGIVDFDPNVFGIVTMQSVIVGRNLDGTPDISRLNPVQSLTVNQFVSTQTTRKQGRR